MVQGKCASDTSSAAGDISDHSRQGELSEEERGPCPRQQIEAAGRTVLVAESSPARPASSRPRRSSRVSAGAAKQVDHLPEALLHVGTSKRRSKRARSGGRSSVSANGNRSSEETRYSPSFALASPSPLTPRRHHMATSLRFVSPENLASPARRSGDVPGVEGDSAARRTFAGWWQRSVGDLTGPREAPIRRSSCAEACGMSESGRDRAADVCHPSDSGEKTSSRRRGSRHDFREEAKLAEKEVELDREIERPIHSSRESRASSARRRCTGG